MGYKQDSQDTDIFDSFMLAPPKNKTLDKVNELIDWAPLRNIMSQTYSQSMGRDGFDPVLLFKLLLLEQWYRLSDREVVYMADDSRSFRNFLGLGERKTVPDDTTLVKFRARLRNAQILDELFAEITRQMEAQGLSVREGSIQIVDATIIEAAPNKSNPEKDPDASYTYKGGKHYLGYKLHISQDRRTGLITGHKVTTGKVHDSQVFEELIRQGAKEVMADKAYDNKRIRDFCKQQNIICSVMHQARSHKPVTQSLLEENKRISPIRSFVEGAHATLKRFQRCGRAVYIGLKRVTMQLKFGVLAFNLRRHCALL